jgi:hypothetical protein
MIAMHNPIDEFRLEDMTATPASRPTECTHATSLLLAFQCGAGGIQFRAFCRVCWKDLRGAIAHRIALRELEGAEPIFGDLDLIHRAQACYAREHHS